MTSRSLHDGQALFDVPLDAADRRIADLRLAAASTRERPPVTQPSKRPSLRHVLGLRLLQLGTALLADEPLHRAR